MSNTLTVTDSAPARPEEERAAMPVSPAAPSHPFHKKVAFALVACLMGITGGLGNALVTANLSSIQGALSLTPEQGAWLACSYMMASVTSSVLLIKFREQYGLRNFVKISISVFLALTVAHIFVDTYRMGLAVRFASGFCSTALSTLTVLYMVQAFSLKNAGRALVFGIGLTQLAAPLAWMLSPALLDIGDWGRLYLFEAGLAMCVMAAVTLVELPPVKPVKSFELLDFPVFVLTAAGLALLAGVLMHGRIVWWHEKEWLAWALIASVILLTAVIIIELHRKNPLLQIRWLGAVDTVRFALGAMTLRFLLSQQSFGAVGLLQTVGMGVDQLRFLYGVILIGTITGIGLSIALFTPKTIVPQILASMALIAVGCMFDVSSTSMTRPHDMFTSQFLISLAAGMFMGPLMLVGVMKALKHGPQYIVSFAILFSMTQNLGGLGGSAIFGSLQVVREKHHFSYLTEQITHGQPEVRRRLQMYGGMHMPVNTDQSLTGALGVSQVSRIVRRESNVLAFNDVFIAAGTFGMAMFAWSLVHISIAIARARRKAAMPRKEGNDT